MDLKQHLVERAEKYCEAKGIALATLATKVAGDGKFFKRLEKGGTFTAGMYTRFMTFFDEEEKSNA